ncbi:peptidylprolyl isomerase [Flexibacter flexilis DSM 6793]|uniref:Peptidyl-prolyl cis-trans isomerase n=1 Tax=Flexibacter flexilis DSM 6793 TaxID=927664 RepID=A0A1I1JKC9_9BACT|nr:peptidylprolyl isomerase [Flexibacter flexilis]SFC49014.1 peptidylprolyl isomerase [Flexibacter flexilis DSM 6793]
MTAKKGDFVQVHYTGRLRDGSTFDSSEGREPLAFELGSGQMIPGFDAAVHGMNIGDKKEAVIDANEAYGQRSEEMFITFRLDEVPADLNPEVGMQLMLQQPDGSPLPVVVAQVTDEVLVLDANHPLAGQDLIFEIELVAIGQ